MKQRTEPLLSYSDNRFTLTFSTEQDHQGRIAMNQLTWSGVIIAGLLIAGFGLLSAALPEGNANAVQAQDVLFLLSGGLMTSLLGAAGLFGMTGQGASVVKKTK